MKKKILLCLFTVILFSKINAEEFAVQSGNVLISGGLSYSKQSGELFENRDEEGISTFTLTPGIHGFVSDNVALGGTFSYSKTSQGNDSYSILGIGPQLTIFAGTKKSTVFPFVGGGYKFTSFGYEDKITGGGLYLNIGLLAASTKSLGFVTEVIFYGMSGKHKDWDDSISGKIVVFSFGLVGVLY